MAGYSGTPLARKLGYKPGTRALLVGAPPGLDSLLGALPEGARFENGDAADLDLIHLFCHERAELAAQVLPLSNRLGSAGMLWVSWPKKASKVPTDLDGDVVRSLGLAGGLVDVKVCAVDETWSALKFVRRLADRPPRGRIG